MLSHNQNFLSILTALGEEFIPSTAGFMLESLVTHTTTIVESCCKLLLTYMDIRDSTSSSHILFSPFEHQVVSADRSHRIVHMLKLICSHLKIEKTYKKQLKDLEKIGANSVRPQYLPSYDQRREATKSSSASRDTQDLPTLTTRLEEVLSGLRLTLVEDHEAHFHAAFLQIQTVIDWIQNLLSLTAHLMELQTQKMSPMAAKK
jgi:hypothetical protein